MSAPRFALISDGEFQRLPAHEQIDLFWEAEAYTPDPRSSNKNAAARWAAVQKAKAAFWESQQRGKTPRHKRAPRDGLISAAEANEWLRSLPPVPLYGEECDDEGVKNG